MSSPQRRRELQRERESNIEAEEQRRYERIRDVWQVPSHAADAFVNLQDAVGERQADAIAEFVKSMIEGGLE